MNKPKDFLKVKEHNIRSFFESPNIYKVPPYQRAYSWGELELENLWNDIHNAIYPSSNSDDENSEYSKHHFMGTITLVEVSNNVYEIIDGQQRLVTSSIFLKSLLDITNRIEDIESRKKLQHMIVPLLMEENYSNISIKRLNLNPEVDEFYENYILKTNDEEQRKKYLESISLNHANNVYQQLEKVYSFFGNKLKEEFTDSLKQNELFNKLETYIHTFTNLFVIIKIEVDSVKSANQIFEVVNARGKKLLESDLIKNKLFMSINLEKQELITKKWNYMVDVIESEDLTEYIRFHYISAYNFINSKEVARTISGHFKKEDAFNYLNNLKDESVWYARINLIGKPYLCWNQSVIENLKAFKHLGLTGGVPLLLTGAVLFGEDVEKFEDFVGATLSYCFKNSQISKKPMVNLEKEMGIMSRILRNPQSLTTIENEGFNQVISKNNLVDLPSMIAYMKEY